MIDRTDTYEANVATLKRWAEQASGDFFTIDVRNSPPPLEAVLVRKDGKPLGYHEDIIRGSEVPITGVGMAYVYASDVTRLTRRNRRTMAEITRTIQKVGFGQDRDGLYGLARKDLPAFFEGRYTSLASCLNSFEAANRLNIWKS